MVDEKIFDVFKILYSALNNPERKQINWAVTGSLGMVLHGMEMEIHDIDIQTDKDGVYQIERRLVNNLVKLVHFKASERVRSYYGLFEIKGIKIEVMGDMQHLLPDGLWGKPVQIETCRDWVDVEGMHIPVITLEHELEAYQSYSRIEKAEMIKNFLAKK